MSTSTTAHARHVDALSLLHYISYLLVVVARSEHRVAGEDQRGGNGCQFVRHDRACDAVAEAAGKNPPRLGVGVEGADAEVLNDGLCVLRRIPTLEEG